MKPLPQGKKKVWLQLEEFFSTDFFLSEVMRMRRLVGLPEMGLKPTVNDLENLTNLFYVPETFPKQRTKDFYPLKILNIEINAFVKQLPVSSLYIVHLIKYYIVFNQFFYEELKVFEETSIIQDACSLQNEQEIFDEYIHGGEDFIVKEYLELHEDRLWHYPITIGIHPHASQRDVSNFIATHWPLIGAYQQQYANRFKFAQFKNSKTTRKKRTRDIFIFENKHLPLKDIASLVIAEFGEYMDVGHIGAVIELETKRRQKKL